jgi:NitT/TauT family transport system substrate-binding protein
MSAVTAFRLAAILLVTVFVTHAAGAGETHLSLALDRALDASAAPLLLAFDDGDFKSAGVNVSINAGTDAEQAIARVVSGDYEMGVADFTTLIRYKDAHPKAPVKAVFVLTARPAFAIIGRKSRGVVVPKDLEGRRLGAPAADGAFSHWPLFAKVNGIDPARVKVEAISAPVREPMLAAGQLDAITGLTFSAYIDLKQEGVPLSDISVLPMADYGVDLYGNAVIVNTAFAAKNPAAVRGVLRGLLSGLKQTVRDPARAVAAVLRRQDNRDKAIELERMKLLLRDNVLTADVRTVGFGGLDGARFARALDQIGAVFPFRNGRPGEDDIFDASFLPPAADRAVLQVR